MTKHVREIKMLKNLFLLASSLSDGETVRQYLKIFFIWFLPSFLMFFRNLEAAGKTEHLTKEAVEQNL